MKDVTPPRWDNEERRRFYGLRVGDQVTYMKKEGGKVVGYGFTDNNRVYVDFGDGKHVPVVAEWCTITHKVEDSIGP